QRDALQLSIVCCARQVSLHNVELKREVRGYGLQHGLTLSQGRLGQVHPQPHLIRPRRHGIALSRENETDSLIERECVRVVFRYPQSDFVSAFLAWPVNNRSDQRLGNTLPSLRRIDPQRHNLAATWLMRVSLARDGGNRNSAVPGEQRDATAEALTPYFFAIGARLLQRGAEGARILSEGLKTNGPCGLPVISGSTAKLHPHSLALSGEACGSTLGGPVVHKR